MAWCSYCCGEGVVDKGKPNESECPFCCGMGFTPDDDEDEDDDY